MGYTAPGLDRQCLNTGLEAVQAWCLAHEPGNTSTSCDTPTCTWASGTGIGTCLTTRTPTGSTDVNTANKTTVTQACDVPTPVQDAVVFSSAVVAMWVTVAAAMFLYRFFRVPHADAL